MDILTFLLIHTKRHSDAFYNNYFNHIVYYCLAAKILFQLLLVLKLEFIPSIPILWAFVMSPLWCLLFMLSCNLFQKLMSAE